MQKTAEYRIAKAIAVTMMAAFVLYLGVLFYFGLQEVLYGSTTLGFIAVGGAVIAGYLLRTLTNPHLRREVSLEKPREQLANPWQPTVALRNEVLQNSSQSFTLSKLRLWIVFLRSVQ
jgi:hypothetical protein